MQYMLLIYQDAEFERTWGQLGDEDKRELYAKFGAFGELLQRRGAYVAGNELGLSHTATTVRENGDDFVITDGPLAEMAEQLGGYYIVEARDLDEALEFAKALPSETVEVRPIVRSEGAA